MDTISGDELGIKATLGHIGKFDPAEEYICIFGVHRNFFAINGIKDENQVAVFLSFIGPNNYALLRDLLVPKKSHEKSLAALFETLPQYFKLNPVIFSERFRFHR